MSRIPANFLETSPAPEPDGPIAAGVPVPYRNQLMDGWCWAATIEMIVLALARQDIAQCQLANMEFQRDDCCPTNPACNMGAPLTSFAGILLNWGIDSNLIDVPLDFGDVQQQVDAGQPIIYNLTFADGTSHTGVIANAFEDSNGDQWVYFLDSDEEFFRQWGRAPFGWVPFAFILNAYGFPGNWTETILNIRLG